MIRGSDSRFSHSAEQCVSVHFNFARSLQMCISEFSFQAPLKHVAEPVPVCLAVATGTFRLQYSTLPSVMPSSSQRQQAADALHHAFLVNLAYQAESNLAREFFDLNPELGDPAWEDVEDHDGPGVHSHVNSSSSSSSLSTSSSSSLSSTSMPMNTLSSSDLEEPWPSETLTDRLLELYSCHYWRKQKVIKKSDGLLHLLLHDYKYNQPDIFRSYLRVMPDCFDALVDAIHDDPMFHNKSNNSQTPVEIQLAIALYRFGHYRNAASTMKVALNFGISYGFVQLATVRVMKACCTGD